MTKGEAAALALAYLGDPDAVVESAHWVEKRWVVTVRGDLRPPRDGPVGVERRRGFTCRAATVWFDPDRRQPGEPVAVEAWEWS